MTGKVLVVVMSDIAAGSPVHISGGDKVSNYYPVLWGRKGYFTLFFHKLHNMAVFMYQNYTWLAVRLFLSWLVDIFET